VNRESNTELSGFTAAFPGSEQNSISSGNLNCPSYGRRSGQIVESTSVPRGLFGRIHGGDDHVMPHAEQRVWETPDANAFVVPH